jgi:hypothetical protein
LKTDTILIQKSSLSKETIKPKLFVLAYYFIALVLLFSGINKVIAPETFLNTLNTTLGFLGENILILIATALPVIEIALGFMLMLPVPMGKIWRSNDKSKVKETLIATVILFAVFFLFSIYGTVAGFDVDCGCFGSNVSSEFGAGMVVRNIVLLIVSILVYNLKDEIGFVKARN